MTTNIGDAELSINVVYEIGTASELCYRDAKQVTSGENLQLKIISFQNYEYWYLIHTSFKTTKLDLFRAENFRMVDIGISGYRD